MFSLSKKQFSSIVAGVGLLVSTNLFAQTCMNDVYNAFGQGGDLNCTANDISLAAASVNVLDDGCTSPLDTVTLELFADVTLTAQARYDLGFYFATDGGDALTGSCEIATLPVLPDPPFINLDITDTADFCGDIDADHSPILGANLGTMTVACTDTDNDGKLEISSCTSWRQPGKNETCDEGIDAYPGAPSKCRCTPLQIDAVDIPPLESGVEIVKGPELQVIDEGATATFTIDVINTGNTELTNVVVSDPLAPDCDAVFMVLAVGATQSYSCTVENVMDGFTNVASVSTNEGVSDDDDAVVEVEMVVPVLPGVEIVKGPELQVIDEGATATFTIDVINTGNTELTNVVVSDPLAPDCDAVFMVLAVGATQSYSCTVENVMDGFTNVASVSTNEGVSDDDDAVVEVEMVVPVLPGIEIVKGPELQVIDEGATATFTIDVINTGNTELTNVVVSDPLAPDCDAVFMVLAVGATQSYTCTVQNVVNGFTNVASVSTGQGVSDEDDAVVEIEVVEPEPCDAKTGCDNTDPKSDPKSGATDPKSGSTKDSATDGSGGSGGSGK